MPTEQHQDFVQFLRGLLAFTDLEPELRELVRSALAEEDRYRQWQGVLEVLERGVRAGLFRPQGVREIRGVEHLEFLDLTTRRGLSIPRPPVVVHHVTARWPGRSFRLPVPLPTSETSLADALRRILEEEVRWKLGVDAAAVYFMRAEEEAELVAAVRAEGLEAPRRFLPLHVDRWALGRGLSVVVGDLRRDQELNLYSQRGTLRSVVATPILGEEGDRPVGILEAWSRQPHFFSGDELGCLAAVAQFLADIGANALYLRDQIFRDDLTGVFNRRYFDRVLLDTEMIRSQRSGHEFALLLADIDDFKRVNDRFGHPSGDQVLRQVATLLSERVRPGVDIVSRYGGEEFAVLLPEVKGLAGARLVAERLRKEVASFDFSLVCRDLSEPITISIGGALYWGAPRTTDQVRTLEKQQIIDRADQALYQAKRSSKNCYVIWDEAGMFGSPAGGLPHGEGGAGHV